MALKVLAGLILAFCAGQLLVFAGLMIWMIWTDSIKPRLISADEIGRIADEIIEGFSDPEEEAFLRQQAAWYRSEGAEQTYWYRVRKAIRRRLEQA